MRLQQPLDLPQQFGRVRLIAAPAGILDHAQLSSHPLGLARGELRAIRGEYARLPPLVGPQGIHDAQRVAILVGKWSITGFCGVSERDRARNHEATQEFRRHVSQTSLNREIA